jgi:hypothetical protein
VAPSSYNVFAEIDDRTLDPFTGTGNPPVRVTTFQLLQLGPEGSTPLNSPPQLVFIDPLPNLGFSADDEATIRYVYGDIDSTVTVTLILDKDLNPNNDDINNPGDPLDPASKIIILPSSPRRVSDPTFGGDPPPPDDPNNPPADPDSLEIRTNPRILNPTAPAILPFPGAPIPGELKEYRFNIDFSQVPPRSQPYFIRATIADGVSMRHSYAVGSLTISALASGIVDVKKMGFDFAGARFQGFSEQENFGTDFVQVTDIDLDGVEDFMIASRFASPRNRFQPGAGYLVFGRRKTPFPPDTNGNGIPDVVDSNGDVVDFPEPPDFVPNPYNANNVGRFGGTISINSISSFFRGTVYAMPESRVRLSPIAIAPPGDLLDPNHASAFTAGLTSITRFDFTADGVADLVFGLPYISGAYDHHDDDPADGGCDFPYSWDTHPLPDFNPNPLVCDDFDNDDIGAFGFNEFLILRVWSSWWTERRISGESLGDLLMQGSLVSSILSVAWMTRG